MKETYPLVYHDNRLWAVITSATHEQMTTIKRGGGHYVHIINSTGEPDLVGLFLKVYNRGKCTPADILNTSFRPTRNDALFVNPPPTFVQMENEWGEICP